MRCTNTIECSRNSSYMTWGGTNPLYHPHTLTECNTSQRVRRKLSNAIPTSYAPDHSHRRVLGIAWTCINNPSNCSCFTMFIHHWDNSLTITSLVALILQHLSHYPSRLQAIRNLSPILTATHAVFTWWPFCSFVTWRMETGSLSSYEWRESAMFLVPFMFWMISKWMKLNTRSAKTLLHSCRLITRRPYKKKVNSPITW